MTSDTASVTAGTPRAAGNDGATDGTSPTRDVFLCHASPDWAAASGLVERLEADGIRCWIAPRDVTPGSLYADSIVRAINGTRVLVLLLTKSAVESPHVSKEIERASSKRHPILAIRLEPVALPPAFEYFLSESHWLDATAGIVDGLAPKLVQAVHELCAGAATSTPPAPPARQAAARSARRIPRIAWAVTPVLAVAVALVVWRFAGSGRAHDPPPAGDARAKSIAVLPFADMSEKKDQEYFGDGMAEEILNLLARMPDLKVIGRTSSFQFKGKADDLRKIGASLGAAYVLEGSVRRAGDRIRVTAQLIDVKDGTHLWSETYDREVSDVLNVQAEIAASLARSLRIEVGGAGHGSAAPVRTDAYIAYLQGRHAASQFSRTGLEEGISEFERALALDPGLLRAREELAEAHFLQYGFAFAPAADVIPGLRREIDEILRIDPRSVTAHGLRARLLTSYDWDWAEAQREVDQTLSLDPGSGLGLYAAADLALVLGHHDTAERLFRKALSADPLDDDTRIELATAMSFAGRSVEAVDEARQVLARHPSYAGIHYDVGLMMVLQGRPELALQEVQLEVVEGVRDAGLAIVYHALRRDAESEAAMRAAERTAGDAFPFHVACSHAYRRETNSAFAWLDKAYAQRDYYLQYVKVSPWAAALRDDPRYGSLLRRMKLPE